MGDYGPTPWIPAQIDGPCPTDPRRADLARVRGAVLIIAAIALAALSPLVAGPATRRATDSAALCVDDPAYRFFEFWVGDWSVYVDAQRAGRVHVSAVAGCAFLARWERPPRTEATFLYFATQDRLWKRVSVAASGNAPRPAREEILDPGRAEDVVRFVGRGQRGERSRTTLRRDGDGRLRHTEESSRDGGRTWTTTFEAVLVRA